MEGRYVAFHLSGRCIRCAYGKRFDHGEQERKGREKVLEESEGKRKAPDVYLRVATRGAVGRAFGGG